LQSASVAFKTATLLVSAIHGLASALTAHDG
jgi:hypothetical protein